MIICNIAEVKSLRKFETDFILWVQLDWPSETDTLKFNLQRDREGCDGSETTYKKLSTRRIQLCGDPKLGSLHSWMRPVESASTDVSGASEVPQSRGKLFFCVLATYLNRCTSEYLVTAPVSKRFAYLLDSDLFLRNQPRRPIFQGTSV